jgi:hypothetical protein
MLHTLPTTGEKPAQSRQPNVFTYRSRQELRANHEHAAICEIARRLAALRGARYCGDVDLEGELSGKNYFVPDETLTTETASRLGIKDERDLFGGVVPFEFVPGKAITHALPHDAADQPEGWSMALGDRIENETLRGYSAFSVQDGYRAGIALLRDGPVRIKPVRAKGGRGQVVVTDEAALRRALGVIDPAELAKFGLVIEENLEEVKTLSVGFANNVSLSICYYGTQTLTPNNEGHERYGGSELTVVRGNADCLLTQEMRPHERTAVEQAFRYDRAALACYPDVIASRRNYDIGQGRDVQGRWRSGVLEQSWRVGGASPAEVTAFETFQAEPEREVVRVRCVERYGKAIEVPPDASLYFDGVDDDVGPLVKYAEIVR